MKPRQIAMSCNLIFQVKQLTFEILNDTMMEQRINLFF